MRGLKVGFLLLALAVGGCGDDGGSTSAEEVSTSAVRTQAQFAAEANDLCTRHRERIETELQPLLAEDEGPKQPAALASVIVNDAIAPGFEREIAALRALEPPAGSDGGVAAIVAAMEEELARARQNPLEFSRGKRPFEGSERVAEKHGLAACGGI